MKATVKTTKIEAINLELSREEAELLVEFFVYDSTIPEALENVSNAEFADRVGEFMDDVREAVSEQLNQEDDN